MQIDNRAYSSYNTPFFTSYKSAFTKKLDDMLACKNYTQEDIVEITDKANKIIENCIDEEHFLGKGSLGSVYKIDSKYVIKLPFWTNKLGDFRILPNKFPSLETYYGGEVADFGLVKILRSVSPDGKHDTVGVPYSYAKTHNYREFSRYYEEVSFPRIMNIPQESFDKLASDCAKLNKMNGYTFDYINPNNFVLVGDEIRVVDSIISTLCFNNNSIANLMRPFIWAEGVGVEAAFSQTLLEPRRDIFKKIVLAGMRHDLPVVSGGSEYVLEEVFELLCRANTKTQKFTKQLEKIKQDFPDVKERLECTRQYLETIWE